MSQQLKQFESQVKHIRKVDDKVKAFNQNYKVLKGAHQNKMFPMPPKPNHNVLIYNLSPTFVSPNNARPQSGQGFVSRHRQRRARKQSQVKAEGRDKQKSEQTLETKRDQD
jgi:hypothetical protein